MRIPKKFKIKGKDWRVLYKWSLRHEDGTPCDGLCDPVERIIWLDHLATRSTKFSTFLHEYCHAVIEETGVADSGLLHIGGNEIICGALQDCLETHFSIRWKPNAK